MQEEEMKCKNQSKTKLAWSKNKISYQKFVSYGNFERSNQKQVSSLYFYIIFISIRSIYALSEFILNFVINIRT